MKIKVTLISCFLSIASFSGVAADSCSQSAQESHQDKFERFMIDEVPSLLDSCGLGDLVIDMPTMPSFGADLFCGFGTNDLMGFYGDYSSNSFQTGSSSSGSGTSTSPVDISTPIISAPIDTTPIIRPPTTGNPQAQPSEKWVPADLFKNK
ncbi:hypothetical protein GCM10011607_11610 [Shewanella inventionis]|uniref:Secreted protein n=1 Tax=Shewanella inventionis TaxID=1738770 RepID=A0ABQ1IUE5_9GAMM|nr:hypothetical protein [Shewanella inventionis]GGB52788.1 hypothetical protein GCM10011607_11610 [Shewanella inventionis]